MKEYEVHIPLRRGKQITLFLSPSKDEDIYEDERSGGVPFQLIEGKRYYFELSDAAYYIDGDKQVIACYHSRSGVSNGTITTGNFVGTFTADIKQRDTDEKVGLFSIEIRSTKIGYEDDYRKMMEDASPYDKKWGVGMSEEDKDIHNPHNWKGQNRLGFILMEVRETLLSTTERGSR